MTTPFDPVRELPVFRRLRVERPLAFLSLRATGDDPLADRLVELAVLRVEPGPAYTEFHTAIRVEPVTPKFANSPYVLTGEAARGVPSFPDVAERVLGLIDRADLAGFDLLETLPLLAAELRRCGRDLPPTRFGLVDVAAAYRDQEPRGLEDAVRHYLGVRLFPLRGAGVEARLTAWVLDALMAGDPSLPADPAGLQDALGASGATPTLLPWAGAGEVIGWGRYAGRRLDRTAEENPGYLRQLLTHPLTWQERAAVASALGRVGEATTTIDPDGSP